MGTVVCEKNWEVAFSSTASPQFVFSNKLGRIYCQGFRWDENDSEAVCKHLLPFLTSKNAQTPYLHHTQPNCHGNGGVLALETLAHLCMHSRNEVALLAAESVQFCLNRSVQRSVSCADRFSRLISPNKVADCKHQVTEDFSVYYAIPLNHGRRDFTGWWWWGGGRDTTVSGLTSLHAEVFNRAVTGRALIIRELVVEITLFWGVVCPLFYFLLKSPFYSLASLKELIFAGRLTCTDFHRSL